ncbi:MAG: M15 family metallopeptidase [Rickettsiales bacterium]|nr:M15 family metallopeptidase [Rickettsiales bacterium]
MFKFSDNSIQLLNTVDKKLGILANEVIKTSKIDFGISDGWRNQETQYRYFQDGKSKYNGIKNKSKHQDGKAIDIICYDLKTGKTSYDKKYYYYIAGLFQLKAEELKVNLIWGGWWSFEDCCHFELKS